MKRHRIVESEAKAPIWILSFGDMITNLLAFFILLQSFSHCQRGEIGEVGDLHTGDHMVDMGGAGKWMFDRGPGPSFKFKQRRYAVESDPDAGQPQRIIDAEDEQIRKLFDDLRRAMDTRTSDQPPPLTRIVTTPIRFNPSEAALDAPAMDFLATLVSELGQDMQTDQADVYVFATAPDAASTKEQFILSARRAQVVRDRLARNFVEKPSGTSSRLLARGIGAGHWGVNAAAISPPSVVIAVVSPVRKE